ncbi:hypothetical protein CLV59_108180 [Chitinophaga dinghuensis]|uniref:Uncharacterized protein n=1 Tax=Chitinophaga dinghuensis TaxID=1539050 RepID=A0A327VRI5_9BACT|nr:hypothetical protein CLV59_108180 [Chitinophaga dinghuensis]
MEDLLHTKPQQKGKFSNVIQMGHSGRAASRMFAYWKHSFTSNTFRNQHKTDDYTITLIRILHLSDKGFGPHP